MNLLETLEECLTYFSCQHCGTCCREAAISLTEAELIVLMKRNGPGILDYLSPDVIQHIFKPPCGYLDENKCRCYEARPASCSTYPFMFMKTGNATILALSQCPMGVQIRQSLEKYLYRERRCRGISDRQYQAMQTKTDQQTRIIEARAREHAKAAGLPGNLVEVVTVPHLILPGLLEYLRERQPKSQEIPEKRL